MCVAQTTETTTLTRMLLLLCCFEDLEKFLLSPYTRGSWPDKRALLWSDLLRSVRKMSIRFSHAKHSTTSIGLNKWGQTRVSPLFDSSSHNITSLEPTLTLSLSLSLLNLRFIDGQTGQILFWTRFLVHSRGQNSVSILVGSHLASSWRCWRNNTRRAMAKQRKFFPPSC